MLDEISPMLNSGGNPCYDSETVTDKSKPIAKIMTSWGCHHKLFYGRNKRNLTSIECSLELVHSLDAKPLAL